MKVVLAEKPSVARDIAKFLGAKSRHDGYLEGNGYQVTWAYGHLVTLKEPGDYDPSLKRWTLPPLPFIPAQFELKVISSKHGKKQFRIVKQLFKGASELICATDAGREGELIFRYILQHSGCRRKPVQRLWLNSLTSKAIKAGFANLKGATHYDSLFAAARCRSEADWIVGLNATRSYTIKYGNRSQLWSAGRVQTPVLAMIVQRDNEIANFKAEKFWELLTDYRGVVFKYTGKRFPKTEVANQMLARIQGQPFTVTEVSSKRQSVPPPLLFDLTELQRHMNRRCHLSAAATLKIAQQLYESKLLTYPRTDSRYLSSDIKPEVPGILAKLAKTKPDAIEGLDLTALSYTKRIFNDAKVSDHHAIIPTGKTASGLTGNAAQVYEAVVLRFIAAFHPACEKLKTTVNGVSNEVPFRAHGTQILKPGWTALYPGMNRPRKDKEEEDQALPEFKQGESGPHQPRVKEGVTKPPSHYNDSSLLSAMETCGKNIDDEQLREALKAKGLGTPATRAQIIETLIAREYISRDRKQLLATDAGRYLVALVGNGSLKSPELTGEWEGKLKQVEAGDLSAEKFISEIADYTAGIVRGDSAPPLDASRLGPCPLCGREVIEGKTGYGCSGWKDGCTFVLWGQYKNSALDPKQIRELLQHGRLSAPTTIIDEGGMRQVLLLMNSTGEPEEVPVPMAGKRASGGARKYSRRRAGKAGSGGKRHSPAATPAAEPQAELGDCPICGKPISVSPKAYGCSDWKNGCKFTIWKKIAGKNITVKTAQLLLEKGQTGVLKGFKSKAGKPFQARLKLAGDQVKLDFA